MQGGWKGVWHGALGPRDQLLQLQSLVLLCPLVLPRPQSIPRRASPAVTSHFSAKFKVSA